MSPAIRRQGITSTPCMHLYARKENASKLSVRMSMVSMGCIKNHR